MRSLRLTQWLVLSIVAAGCARGTRAATAPTPAAAPGAPAAASVTADELRQDLFVFAADSFRGRETGTPDAERAAQWLAARLTKLGFKPAGDNGTFLQRVPLERTALAPTSRIAVATPTGERVIPIGRDLYPIPGIALPGQRARDSVDAEIIFAGYGIQDAALGRDDLKGLDVKGKVVVLSLGLPPGLDSGAAARLEKLQNPNAKLGLLFPLGPAAVVLLSPDTAQVHAIYASFASQVAQAEAPPSAGGEQSPMLIVGSVMPGVPLLPADFPANNAARAMTGFRLAARVDLTRQPVAAHNVVAVLPGSDPTMAGTYVAFGAHYDHIGIQPPNASGDSIANGADDDGSGSVTLLAIARAAKAGPPLKRSLLFVWHVGEEKGLWGSEYFTDHPTVPIDSIVAQLNADMIGRNAADSLYLVGPEAAPNGQSRVLGGIIDSVNTAQRRPFLVNREWDSPTHPERIYYRSDHFNYAKKGVPIVFFTTGLHKDYHQVTDEPALIEYDKMARVGALILDAGRAVANRPTRPKAPPPVQ